MNKILFLILLGFSPFLNAQEPTLAMLQSVNSNTLQLFRISTADFLCKAYGVIGMETLEQNSKLDSACKEKIKKFNLQNPQMKYYAQKKLKVQQRYHVEFKEKGCLLFASGEITLSELLLKEGLSVLKADFKDEEYSWVYKKAQENAKLQKKGVWKDEIISDCIAEIYKN